jgi:hypothetical protein
MTQIDVDYRIELVLNRLESLIRAAETIIHQLDPEEQRKKRDAEKNERESALYRRIEQLVKLRLRPPGSFKGSGYFFVVQVVARRCARQPYGIVRADPNYEKVAEKFLEELSPDSIPLDTIKKPGPWRDRLAEMLEGWRTRESTAGFSQVRSKQLADVSITQLDLCVRGRKALRRLGIETIGQLLTKSAGDLLCARNFGMGSLAELKAKLAGLGLELKDE